MQRYITVDRQSRSRCAPAETSHQICKARGIFWRTVRLTGKRDEFSTSLAGDYRGRSRGCVRGGSRKIPRARFVIPRATGGGARVLVPKECDAHGKLCQKYRPSTYQATYLRLSPLSPPLRVRGRVLSGCLHRYTVALVVLETVAIFARSWQEDNETRPDTRYTTVPCASLRRLSLHLARTFVLHHPPYNRRPIIQPRRCRCIQPAKKRAGEGVRW
jgi:hypothetical protein